MIANLNKEPLDIKSIRAKLGFTQEDLARKLGLALSTVSKWEQGVTSPSRLAREKLEKLIKIRREEKEVSEPSSHRLLPYWLTSFSPLVFLLTPIDEFDKLLVIIYC